MSSHELIANFIDCSRCGEKVSSRAAYGLCPRCLLRTLEADDELESGEEVRVFGDYELLSEIARGGMGTVFKARQRSLNRTVAVKVITAGALASREMVERFRTEAEAAARLSHPNIVPIYEVGEHEGQQFFSMEWIDGPRLDQLPPSDPMSPRRAAELLIKIAQAVHFAHQRGILHRDIKPGNILVGTDGEPRLMDFGLAKVLERESTITHTLALLGTPSYMAPEQARGESKGLTTAADVYSLGAVLYQLCTGVPPFGGGTTFETVRQVLENEPRKPSLLNRAVDPDLETICLKCLEKEPEKRYASAEALAADLRHWTRGEPIDARPIAHAERLLKWARRHPARAMLLGGLSLAAVVMAAGSMLFTYHLNEKSKESNQRLVRLFLNQAAQKMAEGDHFAALPWAIQALKVDASHSQDEDIARRRIHSILAHSPRLRGAWFHDANAVAAFFITNEERVVVQYETNRAGVFDIKTGARLKSLQHRANISALDVSTDRIATADEKGEIQLWNASTLAPIFSALNHSARVNCIRFSPDGEQFVTCSDDFSAAVWDRRTGALIQKLVHKGRVETAAFHPGKKVLVTGTTSGTAVVWNLETGQPLFDLKYPRPTAVRHVEFSPDGERILTSAGPGVQVWSATTGEPIGPQVSHPNVYTYMGSFSPDGRSFATCGRDSVARVWQTDTGSALSAPLRHEHGVSFVRFDPSGTRLASASFDQTVRIWDWVNGQLLYPPLDHSSPAVHAVFSQDGRSILTTDANSTRLWDISEREPVAKIQANSIVRRCAFTPDSRYFVYQCEDGDTHAWDFVNMRHSSGLSPTGSLALEANRFQYPYGHAISRDAALEIRVSKTSALLIQQPGNRTIAPLPHREYVAVAVFSDDGRMVVTGSADKTARVWDTKSGLPVTPPLPHFSTAMYARFSPDYRWLMTMSNGRTIYFWSLDAEKRPLRQLDALSDLLTARRINDSGVLARIEHPLEIAEAWKTVQQSVESRDAWRPLTSAGVEEAQAQHHEVAGELVKAVQAYSGAIEKSPGDNYLFWKRAVLSLQLGNWTNALADLNQTLALNTNAAANWEARGRAFLAMGKGEEAASDFERALSIDPDYVNAWNGLGKYRSQLKEWKASLDAFEKARMSWAKIVGPQPVYIPPRNSAATIQQLDLGNFYNVDLNNARRDGDRGPDDLASLPQGLFRTDGAVFDVRGAIRLLARPTALYWAILPERVEGIPIQGKCRKLHFLHSTMGETAEGTVIGKYVLQYADGEREEIPLVYGAQMRDSFLPAVNPLTDPQSNLAFALNPPTSGANHAVYHTHWLNRKDQTEIVMLHFESSLTTSAPFLLALTIE